MRTLFILLLAWPLLAGADIYRWTDASGQVHFGDAPRQQDAQKVEVKVQTVTTVRVRPLPGSSEAPTTSAREVVMYSTDWCGVCKRAKRYFEAQGIRYREKDIETDPAWRQEFDRLGGTGVPLIVVGGQTMSGFSEQRFAALYRQR